MYKNLELNLGHYDDQLVGRVEEWFDLLWENSKPFNLAEIYEEMLHNISPYLVYLRVLIELYGDEISLESDELGLIPVTNFQRHGSERAHRILDKYGGVLIADGVGLGKTFIAGQIIQKYRENRQRVLLVCPAALRDTEWKKFLFDYQLLVEVVSYEQLANDAQFNPGGKRHLNTPIEDYALVVVDEAHNYRNPDTPSRASILRQLLYGKRRDIVFLTATPVNNSLWDLYHIIRYFLKQDASLSDLGIRSIRSRFNAAMQEDPFDLNPDILYPIIDATTVKRTRKFIKKHYSNDRIPGPDGRRIPIRFPTPKASSIKYNLEDVLPGFFTKFQDYIMPIKGKPKLTLARYKPEFYPKDKAPQSEDNAIVGLLRSIMLKRFESSSHAFGCTLKTMIKQHELFIAGMDKGFIVLKDFYKEYSASDDIDIDELLSISDNTIPDDNYNIKDLRNNVNNDLEILKELHQDVKQVQQTNSPKLNKLVEELVVISEQAESSGIDIEDINQRKKVLIFSYFEDTVDWIEEYLFEAIEKDPRLKYYKNRFVSVSGKESRNGIPKLNAVCGFAPVSTKALPPDDKDKYDIMICTDVLAEGLNLQQSCNIINFDLPWNPMRLVQRHGRIDRIGSTYDEVYLRTFFPDDKLDDLLQLELRVRTKLAQAAYSIGVEHAPIEFGAEREASFAENKKEIEKLRLGDSSIYEEGGTKGAAQTGEEYRQELRRGIEKYGEEINNIPWKIGSGMETNSDEGIFFCANVGNRTYLRFVPKDSSQEVVKELGTCLRIIECSEDTERKLSVEDYNNAINMWKLARSDIYQDWMYETDPANIQPTIPKLNREVAEYLRNNPPSDIDDKKFEEYLDIIESPWSRRETNQLRTVFKDESITSNEDRIRLLLETVDRLGIEAMTIQEPLPPIEKEEIHLICWMSIHKTEMKIKT